MSVVGFCSKRVLCTGSVRPAVAVYVVCRTPGRNVHGIPITVFNMKYTQS